MEQRRQSDPRDLLGARSVSAKTNEAFARVAQIDYVHGAVLSNGDLAGTPPLLSNGRVPSYL